MRSQRVGKAGQSSYQIDGLEDFVLTLRSLPSSVADNLIRQAVYEAFKPALKAIRALCPVKTGTLRDSIQIEVRRNSNGGYTALIVCNQGDFLGLTFYAAFIEYGTLKLPAQPFMRPGFDGSIAEVMRNLEQLLAYGIEVEMKRAA